MVVLLIVCLILALIFAIDIEVRIDNTYWIDRETDRPIIVLHYDSSKGVIYKYAGDQFERHMRLIDLLTKFKYNGT